jgi:hypothetical protein
VRLLTNKPAASGGGGYATCARPLPPPKARPAATDWCLFRACNSIPVIFQTPEGETIPVVAASGDNLLDLAHANNIELEGTWAGPDPHKCL